MDKAEAAKKIKLLVPTNFSHKSEMALRFALNYSYRRGGGAEVFLFHSYDQKNVDYRQLDRINADVIERMKTAVLEAIKAMEDVGEGHSVDTVHRRLSYGKAPAEILKMAAGMGADMILMGHPSSSNFRRLIEKSPCTLLLLKDKDPTFVTE